MGILYAMFELENIFKLFIGFKYENKSVFVEKFDKFHFFVN